MDICDAASSNLQGMESPFAAARYHSLVIEKDSCPGELEVTAWTEDGTIMAVRHRKYPHIQARALPVEGACMGCGACKMLCLVTYHSRCLRPQMQSDLHGLQRACDAQGVQFHPESIITDNGMMIVHNFVKTL